MSVDVLAKWVSLASDLATFVAVFVAGYAAWVGYKQLKSSKEEERKSIAYDIYHQYLQLCIANPEFSGGFKKPENKTLEYDRYRWFVSAMLFSFEQIMETQSEDFKWVATIKSQLLIHKEFLKISRTVREKEWSNELQKIIQNIII